MKLTLKEVKNVKVGHEDKHSKHRGSRAFGAHKRGSDLIHDLGGLP